MPEESYPCYVRISEGPESEEVIELPTEGDGKLMLTTITAQYPDAIGLRFKSESGAWRGMRFIDGALEPPIEGWGYNDYFITTGAAPAVVKKAEKRKLESDSQGPASSKTKPDLLSDLIVLGLPYSATEDDLKSYFEKYGELAHCELKVDMNTKKSKGFGFIRFKTEEAAQTVLDESHTLGGRNLDVKFPYQKQPFQDNIPTKLFVGRLPGGTTTDQLREHFEEYGPLKDVYIPKNFRGFGFVTFGSQSAAQSAMSATHQLNGGYLNLTYPQPKHTDGQPDQMPQKYVYGQGTVVPGPVPGMAHQYMMPQGGSMRGGASSQGGYYTPGYSTGYQQPYQQQQRGNWKR